MEFGKKKKISPFMDLLSVVLLSVREGKLYVNLDEVLTA